LGTGVDCSVVGSSADVVLVAAVVAVVVGASVVDVDGFKVVVDCSVVGSLADVVLVAAAVVVVVGAAVVDTSPPQPTVSANVSRPAYSSPLSTCTDSRSDKADAPFNGWLTAEYMAAVSLKVASLASPSPSKSPFRRKFPLKPFEGRSAPSKCTNGTHISPASIL